MEVGKEIRSFHLRNKSKRFIVAQYQRVFRPRPFKAFERGLERVQMYATCRMLPLVGSVETNRAYSVRVSTHIRFLRQAGGQLNPRCFQQTSELAAFVVPCRLIDGVAFPGSAQAGIFGKCEISDGEVCVVEVDLQLTQDGSWRSRVIYCQRLITTSFLSVWNSLPH